MANGKNDEPGTRPRISAWLPPGLALGWLAVLATFVHGLVRLLGVWAVSVFFVILFVLLSVQVQRRFGGSSGTHYQTESDPTGTPGDSPTASEPTPATSPQAVPLSPETSEGSADKSTSYTGGEAARLVITETPTALELRILTAAEVASVLRVDTSVVIKAISDGEFPGNRIGSYWRVDQGALTRWLQGTYRDPASPHETDLS